MSDESDNQFNKRLEEFRRLTSPSLYVGGVSGVSLTTLWFLDGSVITIQHLTNGEIGRLLFLGYFTILVAMWVVYFFSIYQVIQTRTLRRLLFLIADEWRLDSKWNEGKNTKSFAERTRDKARASMTMLALLTGGSALLMTQSLNYIDSEMSAPLTSGLFDIWHQWLLIGSATFAAIALVCFIVSVDSLDVLFNHFGGEQSRSDDHVVHFLYTSKRNARYYGIMLFLWSACLFTGSFSPFFGILVVIVVIITGWSHWFPYPPLLETPKSNGDSRVSAMPSSLSFETLLRAGIMVLPVLWALQF